MTTSYTTGPAVGLTASVVIPTYNRPEHVRSCLQHLALQTVQPVEIVVVDSSPDDRTKQVVENGFPEVRYVRNPMGRGATAESRQIGLGLVTADVLAFLDDDANARPDWLEQILRRYADPAVAGVGGSALNGIEGERSEGIGSIGLLLPDGRLTGYFAADPGRDIDVDHLLGANMSYRRSALLAVGGIYGGYPGTCLREESDIALRVTRSGARLVYTPAAVVEHVPGPYAKGKRFDRRYSYYANRNHIVLLTRNFGLGSQILRRYFVTAQRELTQEIIRGARGAAAFRTIGPKRAIRAFGGGTSRAAAQIAGLAVGLPVAVRLLKSDQRRAAGRSIEGAVAG